MAVVTLSAVVGGVLGIIGWVKSLPAWLLYLLWLASLSLETGVAGFFGLGSGPIAATVSFLVANTFNIPGFYISAPLLLVLSILIPGFIFCLKH